MRKQDSRLLISVSITLGAASLFVSHLLFPKLALDAISLFLVAFAIVPWLGRLFTKIELPGGLKFEYAAFAEAAKEAQASGLLRSESLLPTSMSADQQKPAYVHLLHSDPNLALAGLRIDVEQHLRALAHTRELGSPKAGIHLLLRDLAGAEVLTNRQVEALRDILGSLNGAAHGLKIKESDAKRVMRVGLDLLASLHDFD